MTTLHYTSGGSAAGAAADGFNLADVQSVAALNELPAGMKGLVWLDEGDGVTTSFLDKVRPFIGNPKVYGFFLLDEPDITGQWGKLTSPDDLKAEFDWIHANLPGTKTFISMMQMGSSANPDFSNTFNPTNTHIDYFGLSPYPVRSETSTVDYDMIDRTVAAAVASGIPTDKIVPIYQAFGGGTWHDDSGGGYVVPTAAQEQEMMDHWAHLVPSPAFDYAYSWGSQQGDTALESSPALQQVFLQHNTAGGGTTPSGGGSLTGDAAANILTGTAGSDTIEGLGGNDTINGLAGDDKLTGGSGHDNLIGGVGADTFIYSSIADSTVGIAGRDVIQDFSHGEGDKVGLTAIDADTTTAGNQDFHFIGTGAFTGHAGELRYTASHGHAIVYGDVNGDSHADFSIYVAQASSLAAGDFLL